MFSKFINKSTQKISIFLCKASYERSLFFLLCLKAIFLTSVILYFGIGLGPDEAQYWTWSRALDWGYYSKPPGVAWQIWLGTTFFGHTEWGVRSFSVFLAFFQAWAVYFLATRCGLSQRAAFWSALLMAFSPLGILGSLFAITDVGFLLCWTGACAVVCAALSSNQAPNPLLIGVWILFGSLFKWPIYLFWIFYLSVYFWYFPQQKLKWILMGFFISLLGLLPSLWWNYSHDWATFRHVFATVQGGSSAKAGGNFFEFLASQAALLSPILFVLMGLAVSQWIRIRTLSPPLFFCGLVTLGTLSLALGVSLFQKVQGNWAIYAYPTAMVLMGWFFIQQKTQYFNWLKMGVYLSLILSAAVFTLPIPFRYNPFKHNLGWANLHHVLQEKGYDPNAHFLVSDKYQTASILSFYGGEQKRAYFLNLSGVRKNQFSYWTGLKEEQKDTGYFIWIENMPHLQREWQNKVIFYENLLKNHFEQVEFLELAPLMQHNSTLNKGVLMFRCTGYNRLQPIESQLY